MQAEELGIDVIRGSKGATEKCQPLDRCTFAALQSKSRAKWQFIFSQQYGKRYTKAIAAELLLRSWDELYKSAVPAGWDFDEAAEDEQSEWDSSDEENVLGIDITSSDEDLGEPGEALGDEGLE
jgi:hypothetical protein